MKRALPVAIATLSIAWIAYFWWGRWCEAPLAVWLASGLAITGAVAGAIVPAARVRTHAVIAGCMMLTLAGFATTRVIGAWPFQWDAMPDARYAGMLAVLGLGVGVGLCAGAFWARWAAMAFAAGSVLGGSLNSLHWIGNRSETAWLAAMGVIGGAVLLSELARGEVATYFARHSRHALWSSRDRLVRLTRWAAIANLAAAPMLVLYAFGQPMAPSTVPSALALAPVLLAGSVLVVMRRTAGIAVLALGGIALALHTVASATYTIAGGLPIVGYYATFWLPAAGLGMASGVAALLRSRT